MNALIKKALAARRSLSLDETLDAYRIFNGRSDGADGLVIERFGEVLVVQLHEGRLPGGENRVREALEELARELGVRAVYRKVFVRDRGHVSPEVLRGMQDPQPWIGDPVEPEFVIAEGGLRFLIRPYDGFSVGLFLEHRDNRRRVREMAGGRRVLNAFCYTCGFSIAAAAGGAASVSSVDASKRYLEWGKCNFALNGLDLSPHLFFCSDVMEFYKRAKRQGRQYDMVILDPPTFSRSRRPKHEFVLEEQLEPLCAGAAELLERDGVVLLATNHRGITSERLEAALKSAAGSRAFEVLDRPALPIDFAGDPDYSRTIIARLG